MDTSPTQAYAEFVATLRYESIPMEVVQKQKLHLLDGLGNALYGAASSFGQALTRCVSRWGGPPEATIWGTPIRTSSLQAAFANGSFANVAELEDAHHRTKFKPNTLLVPAGIAVSEALHLSGHDLLTGLIAGNEVGIRVGEAIHSGAEVYARGWLGTGVLGALATAACVSKILKLDTSHVASALALGANQPTGIWGSGLTMAKRVMIGRAAENGVLAAFLAADGITGGQDILEAEWGSFPAVISPVCDPERFTFGLGSYWKTLEVGLECYPTKGALHSSLDALLDIVRRHDVPSTDIEEIRVRTTTGVVNNKALHLFPPRDLWEAQHSLRYCLAVAAVDGRCGLDQFAADRLTDSRVLALGARIHVEPNAEADRLYPKTKTAFVDVVTRSGAVYTSRVDYCRGEPENFLSVTEVQEKFRAVARAVLNEEEMDRVIRTVDRLEDLADVGELARVLSTSGAADVSGEKAVSSAAYGDSH